jgi:radical SAM-linked protein
MIYRPVRERDPKKLLSLAGEALSGTGYEDISLLSLSTGDYGPLQGLMERLMGRCAPERIAVSLPSLRVGSLTDSLMAQIKRVRKTGFTIAPEAGSQRLRDVINKNITERALTETLQQAFGLGWRLVKLYFMIGLPTETDEDLNDIVSLVRRLQKACAGKGRKGDLTVSVSTFIPKAHTPFQWCRQISLAESKEKIRILKDALRGKGLRFKWQNPEMSVMEGLWARGDRRLSRLLVRAHKMGCRLDGWSDQFVFHRWQEAMDATGVDMGQFARAKDVSEPLPWDHVESGVSKGFLQDEWMRALAGTCTQDCRHGLCHQCGVCDFESIQPITWDMEDVGQTQSDSRVVNPKSTFKKLTVRYEKRGQARLFGHLEMVKIFMRAFRRAQIPLRFSEGFHPVPKFSFHCALPVGIESIMEYFTVDVPVFVQPDAVMTRVNQTLPEGLCITACKAVFEKSATNMPKKFRYTIRLKDGNFSRRRLLAFQRSPHWLLERRNKKGRVRAVDLKAVVSELRVVSSHDIQMTLDVSSGNHVRPTDVVRAVFCLDERVLKLASILKEPLFPSQC